MILENSVDQDSLFKDALGRDPDCPPFEEFVESIHRGDDSARRHAATCPHCSSELRLYRTFMNGDAGETVESVSSPLRVQGNWRDMRRLIPVTLAVAAGVMLVTIGIGNSRQHPYPSSEDSVDRSQSIELLSPKGELKSVPLTLAWSAVPSAAGYHVRLMEVDKTVLWENTVSSPSVQIPSQIERLILPGKRMLWTVDAIDAGGRTVVTGLQDFHLQLRHDP